MPLTLWVLHSSFGVMAYGGEGEIALPLKLTAYSCGHFCGLACRADVCGLRFASLAATSRPPSTHAEWPLWSQ